MYYTILISQEASYIYTIGSALREWGISPLNTEVRRLLGKRISPSKIIYEITIK